MILCLDVGNTNIVVGCYEGQKQLFQSRLFTNTSLTSDQYAVQLEGILRLNGADISAFDGAAISSVVPPLTTALSAAIEQVIGVVPMAIVSDTKTGLDVKLDKPDELASDLKATAVAALVKYQLPCVIIDMGTATTMTVLDKDGSFLGGAIIPGLRVSLESLVSRTSLLVGIALDSPNHTIGRNTIDSMKSGTVIASAAMLDGMCSRMAQELGQTPSVVATGGLAKTVVPHCKTDIILDENLLMDGILLIYGMNK